MIAAGRNTGATATVHGRQTQTAITAMVRLAEARAAGEGRLSSAQIAESRGLQPPSVAKVLTALAQAGLVKGSPGPGGGFALTRDPAQIRLADVHAVFERDAEASPFELAPASDTVRERLERVRRAVSDLLNDTTLDELAASPDAKPAMNGRKRAATR